jgi:Flp pilus assembly protein TadD
LPNSLSATLTIVLGLMLGGCASQEPARPDVLSGQASLQEVVAAGDAAARARSYVAALVLYRQAVSREPSPELWLRIGMAQQASGQRDAAMEAFENVLWLDPDNEVALEKLALHFTAQSDPRRATVYLDQLLLVDPRNWRAHNARGILADLDGRFADAVEHYIDALEIYPDSPMLINNLGYSRYLLGNYTRAMFHMQAALEIDPDYDVARSNLALVYARQRRYDSALATLLERRSEVEAYTQVGELAYRLGHYPMAETLLQTALSLSPAYIGKASALLRSVRDAMAVEDGQTLASRGP